jgi:hypothetical protein
MTQYTRRSAHTLIELMVAMTAASVLIVGLSSSVFIALKATDTENTATSAILEGGDALDSMLLDIEFALSFSEQTANAITFTVPDRDGDSNPEIIRYAWSGVPGDPLTRQYNGGSVATMLENVHVFQHDLPLPSSNLLSNADMEAGTVNWQETNSGVQNATEAYTGVQSLYVNCLTTGECGVQQDVSAQVANGVTYEIGEWLKTWVSPGNAKVQLRITSTGEGEQIFASNGCSISDSTWHLVDGLVTPTWSGSLLSAYWEAVSDLQEVYLDDAYMRVWQSTEQCINISLQVGSDSRSIVQSGVAFLNSPL